MYSILDANSISDLLSKILKATRVIIVRCALPQYNGNIGCSTLINYYLVPLEDYRLKNRRGAEGAEDRDTESIGNLTPRRE